MSERDTLLPCPFCDAEAAVHENDWCEPPEWRVHCSSAECSASALSDLDVQRAIAAWNRRPHPMSEISDEMVAAVAIAIREAAETFESPVRYYVEDEARTRWEKANRYWERGERDPELDRIHVETDWELESWKILARAALPMVVEECAQVADHSYHQLSTAEAEYATADRAGRAIGMLVAMKIATDIRARKQERDT